MKNYEEYLDLVAKCKNIPNSEIDFASFFGTYFVYDLIKLSSVQRIKMIIKTIFFKRTLSIMSPKEIKLKNKNILFQRVNTNRKDCKNFEEDFIKSTESIVNIYESTVSSYKVNFAFVLQFFAFLKVYFKFKQVNIQDLVESTCLYLQCQSLEKKYLSLLKELDINKVVVYCDAHPYDNYLVQLANKNQKITYTLQHGMFNMSSKEIGDPSYIHCMCSPAKKAFLWGNYAGNQYLKAQTKQTSDIYIVGNKKVRIDLDNCKLKNNNKFLVILDYPTPYQIDVNKKMLQLANEISNSLNINFDIRPHPTDQNSYDISKTVEILTGTITYDIYCDNYDFIVLHNTSMYYELVSLNTQVFRYEDELISTIDDYNFDKINSLENFTSKQQVYKEKIPEGYKYFFIDNRQTKEKYREGILDDHKI